MNVNQNINKLLYALTSKGQLYKINSFKFYSEKTNKYCTKYQILKRRIIPAAINMSIICMVVVFSKKLII